MSAAGGLGSRMARHPSWTHRMLADAGHTFTTLVRSPRPTRRHLAWPSHNRLMLGTAITVVVVAAVMLFIDQRAVVAARDLPTWLVEAFNAFTDLGKSAWFLYPSGALLIAFAIAASRPLSQMSRLTLAALTVRFGFIFLAIALPGLFINVLKHVIGRGRPFVAADNVFAFLPFSWLPAYASMPSGHGTTAFSAVIAIGAVWPSARPLLWTYAVLIGISRVVVTAHYPSDVIVGGVIGLTGALLVRNWFASRRLGFVVTDDGAVHRLPGPSWARIKAVARRLLSA